MTGPGQAIDTRVAYWRKNLRIMAALLVVWFVSTFVFAIFGRELSLDEAQGFAEEEGRG